MILAIRIAEVEVRNAVIRVFAARVGFCAPSDGQILYLIYKNFILIAIVGTVISARFPVPFLTF